MADSDAALDHRAFALRQPEKSTVTLLAERLSLQVEDWPQQIERLRVADPSLQRFGAHVHAYRLRACMTTARAEEIERLLDVQLPADYREFLTHVGSSGVGPGYGVLPLDGAAQLEHLRTPFGGPIQPPRVAGEDEDAHYWDDARLDGTVILCHHGCGTLSVLALAGPPQFVGHVFLDGRGMGAGLVHAHDSFTQWYEAWLADNLAFGPRDAVPVANSSCALPNAIGAYLEQIEDRAGVDAGALNEAQVRDALGGLNENSLATRSGEGRCFAEGQPVRHCWRCSRLISRCLARGLMRPSQFVPEVPAKQEPAQPRLS